MQMKLDASLLPLPYFNAHDHQKSVVSPPITSAVGCVEVLDRSFPCSGVRLATRVRRRFLPVTLPHLTWWGMIPKLYLLLAGFPPTWVALFDATVVDPGQVVNVEINLAERKRSELSSAT